MNEMKLSENCVWRSRLLLPRRCFYSSRLQRLSEDTLSLFVQLGIYCCRLNVQPQGVTAARRGYKEPDKVPQKEEQEVLISAKDQAL